jgi:hypothetical protein
LEIGRSHRVPNQGTRVGGWQPFLFRQKLLGEDGGVRRGIVMVKQPKFGATSWHAFTQSPQNVVVELGIHSLACWDQCFALPQPLYRWRHQFGLFWIPPPTAQCNLKFTPLFSAVSFPAIHVVRVESNMTSVSA